MVRVGGVRSVVRASDGGAWLRPHHAHKRQHQPYTAAERHTSARAKTHELHDILASIVRAFQLRRRVLIRWCGGLSFGGSRYQGRLRCGHRRARPSKALSSTRNYVFLLWQVLHTHSYSLRNEYVRKLTPAHSESHDDVMG